MDHPVAVNGPIGRCAGSEPFRTVTVMTAHETFQIPIEAAEFYESKFVPAIFAECAPHTLAAARVDAGDHVLDVACGTGIVARTAAGLVGPDGAAVGVDLNEAMITVARRISPELEWHRGAAGDLPFGDDRFDAVVCQMALMFFPDRQRALEEMARVTRPGGRVVVLVPAALDQQPAYGQFVEIAERHTGADARRLLSAYWSCGDGEELAGTVMAAGLGLVDRRTYTGTARFDSPDDLVTTEVEGSPLAERIEPGDYAAIRRDVSHEMARYVTTTGTFEIPLVCHIATGRVPDTVP